MIDINSLRGSTVRDNAGTKGEVLNLSLPWVRIGWQDEDVLAPREESFLRSDPRMESVEILTLDQGWIPLAALVGTITKEDEDGPRGPSLVEDLEGLLEEGELLVEKPRSPFKTAASIGQGPRHRKRVRKQDYWDCSGSNYKYTCKGKEGETKVITVDPAWKRVYNKQYKKWHKARMDVAAPRRILKRMATQKKAASKKKKPGFLKRIKKGLKKILGRKKG